MLRKIAKNSLIILSGNMGANVFGLLSTVIFTRTMGAEVFGYYVLIQTFLLIMDRLFSFQSWQGFIKYAAGFEGVGQRGNLKMLLKYCFLIDNASILLSLGVTLLLIPVFVSFFDFPPQYAALVWIMAVTLLFRAFEVSTGVFRIYNAFAIQSKIMVAVSVVKAALFALCAVLAPSFEMFVYATVLSQGLMMLLKAHFMRMILKKNGIGVMESVREPIDFPRLKELKILSFTMFANLDMSFRMISRQLDVVLLGKMAAPEVVGVFKIAKEVANIIGQLTDPVYNAVYPELAKLLGGGKKSHAVMVAKRIAVYAGLAGAVFYLGFILLGDLGIRLVFGAEFGDAYRLTCIYFAAIFIAIISLPVTPMMYAFGLVRQAFANQVIANSLYAAAAIPLIYFYSAEGAAAAYSVFYVAWLALSLKTLAPKLQK